MTVLQSLLSTFRRSRTSVRRIRREKQAGGASAEILEARLLLTNPIALSSLPGAPVTIYLDFDGHTEGDQAWTTARLDNTIGDIVTPAFDLDGAPAFNQAETDLIEEIYERVAEDFRPFRINVTTVEPAAFRNGQELLISVGGDGSWSSPNFPTVSPPPNRAISGSFNDGNLPQTAFVFPTGYTAPAGQFGTNLAAGISETVAVTMGLEIHENPDDTRLLGDANVGPILGDGTTSQRDVWFNANGASTAIQDDLAAIVASATTVDYRADDHGNQATASSATAFVIGPGDETLTGIIGQNNDVDTFAFSTTAATADIFVTGLDLRGRLGVANGVTNPGANLSPTITLLDANGTAVASSGNNGSIDARVTATIPEGAYFIQISNRGEYGNLGAYTVTVAGVDVLPSFQNPIVRNSLSSGTTQLYLSFSGSVISDPAILANRIDGGTGNVIIPAYDSDGDLTTFSVLEVAEIDEIWARVAEDFRPFNVNVTTVAPPSLNGTAALQINIGGDGAFLVLPTLGWQGTRGAFADPLLPNVGFTFPDNIQAGAATYPQHIAFQVSSAIGSLLGLGPHPLYNSFGTQVAPFDPGGLEEGPILGAPLNSLRDVWVNAADDQGVGSLQPDLDLITAPQNTIRYRVDDHRSNLSGATVVTVGAGDEFLTGIIETNNDRDLFFFRTLETDATITVKGLDLATQFAGITNPLNPGSNLDPVLRLLDASGNELAMDDVTFDINAPNNSLTASISTHLTASSYYIEVSNGFNPLTGERYGSLGQYTVTLQGVDGNPVAVNIAPDTFAENDGVQTGPQRVEIGVGRVSRPVGEPSTAELVVELTSLNTNEMTVPQFVTIPINQTSATFDVTIIDDTFLDGPQRFAVQASVAGVLNAETFVTVTDHEEITLSLNPNPVDEDAGIASLTITRSNTDVAAPNHWVTVNNNLEERRSDGFLVQTVAVEWPGGGSRPIGEDAHDVLVLQNGGVAVYNGTVNASLSVYTPASDTWRHFSAITGLSGDIADATAGGIASFGDFVFLTDMETTDGDSHGMVRINTVTGEITRFAEDAAGSRLFGMSSTSAFTINEYNPSNGDLLNTIRIQASSGTSRFARGIAYDGANLWALVGVGNSGFEEILKLNPDTGDVLEIHSLGVLQNQNIFFSSFFDGRDGLASMNGQLIVSNEIGLSNFFTFGNELETYDPVSRQAVGGILSIDAVNFRSTFSDSFNDYFTTIPTANVLIATDERGNTIYEIDPTSGLITNSFPTNRQYPTSFGYGEGPGLTSVSDVVIGSTTYNELIYIASTVNEIDIYTRQGTQIDADPTTPGIVDPIHITTPVRGDLAGGDIPGVTAAELKFRDVTVGFDGLVYGLLESGDEISVHDPNSLLRLNTINLDTAVKTIAVGDDSGIYAGGDNGLLVIFDFNGATQVSLATTTLATIADIEVNVGQEVLISDVSGVVARSKQSSLLAGDLTGISLIENTGGVSFVSFGRHPTRPGGDIIVKLNSDDLTELQVPDFVTIPEGQQSITIDVIVVDDNERDGDQTVSLTASSTDYLSDALTVTVNDVETVTVEVIPDSVAENAGTLPQQVRVSRSDIDGPLDFESRQTQRVTTATPILDNDVTLSRITIPREVSQITDLNVTLNIQHQAIPDLDVYLVSPLGTRISLFSDLSSNASNLTNTTLDDQAGVRIVDAAAPYTGRFVPEEFLDAFNGENPSGVWTLEVVDDNRTDTGTLLSWSLDFVTLGLAATQVTLSSGDTSEIQLQPTVTIPFNQDSVLIPLDVIDDDILDGTQTVAVSVDAASLPGFRLRGDTVDVLDAESLVITLDRTVVSEADGPMAIRGTVTRSDTGGTGNLVVTLLSDDTSEIGVPASVTIPAGSSNVSFDVAAVDDLEFDGTQLVTFAASSPGYVTTASPEISVTDQEPRLQLTTLSDNVAEDAGFLTVTLARLDSNDLSVAQSVTLTSSDVTELTVPGIVVIPSGAVSALFKATIHGDAILDGSQLVTITAVDSDTVNPTVNGTTKDITVDDAEALSVTVPAGSERILENAGAGAVTATVSISTSGHTSPIVVNLSNNDPSEASVPQQVMIPVGATSATFLIDAVNDNFIDRDQSVMISADTAGYRTGVLNLTVADHEPPILKGPSFETEDPTPALAWSPVDGATRYDLWLNDVSRNIIQLFRLDNIPATAPLFYSDFQGGPFNVEVDGANRTLPFDPALWDQIATPPTTQDVEADNLAANSAAGTISAHLDEAPNGFDRLQSVSMDISGEAGAQLKYTFQRNTPVPPVDPNTAPTPTQQLVLSYRNAAGAWVELERQFPDQVALDGFIRSTVQLPADALHSNFAFRFETVGTSAGAADDWFIGEVAVAGYPKYIPAQQIGVGRYRFWVRAYDDLEQPGFWSQGRDFRVVTRPEITSPANQSVAASSTFPEISWTTVVDTDRYELWINNVTTGESQVIYETNLQTTSFASAPASLPGGTYQAWTRAIGPDGTAGLWSNPTTFTVLGAPQSITPAGATFDRTPEIRWSSVVGASHYSVWLSLRNPGEAAVPVLIDQFVTGTSRVPDTDLQDGRYVVWVQAISENGTASAWSAGVEFTVGGRPNILAPTESDTTSATPTFLWTGITGAEKYEIWVNRIDVPQSRIVHNTNVLVASFTVQTPLAAGNYRVWVRAISEMGETSFWSKPVDFTVAALPSLSDTRSALPNELFLPGNASDPVMLLRISEPVFAVSPVDRDAELNPQTAVAAVTSEAIAGPAVDGDEAVEDLDFVMSDWAAADWWSRTTGEEENPKDSTPAVAALGLGLLVTQPALKKSVGKKRNRV